MRKSSAQGCARFSLSARLPRSCASTAGRMGGAGRGEVGSSANAKEFNAKTWRGQGATKGARTVLSASPDPLTSNTRTRLSALRENLRRTRRSWEIALQRLKDAKDWSSKFFRFVQARDLARASTRFNVNFNETHEINSPPSIRTLKRRERRAPLASLRLCVFALNRFPFRFAFVCFVCFVVQNSFAADVAILKPASFAHYVERFNSMEDENVTNYISNAGSWSWLQKEIPFFECPDREVEEMYYFRWWSFRKHLVKTPGGFVITEFLTPVKHAGIYNAISCAAGFHIAEGRWLRDQNYLDDYVSFWLHGNNGQPPPLFHRYSSWFAAAVYDRYLTTGDKKFPVNRLGDLVADYKLWESERRTTNGLFWQFDVRDGMEESISGSRTNKNLRPTINSYMFANARAIAAISRLAGNQAVAHEFDAKAAKLKRLMQDLLWNPDNGFFEVRHETVAQVSQPAVSPISKSAEHATLAGRAGLETRETADLEVRATFSGAREEIGFIPWMFGLPDDNQKFAAAWAQLTNPQGFSAPYGITTAERRHPEFRTHGFGHCEWDGAAWPFATSQTLTAMDKSG